MDPFTLVWALLKWVGRDTSGGSGIKQSYSGSARSGLDETLVDVGKHKPCVGEGHSRGGRYLDKAALSIRAVTSTIGMTRS